MTDDDAPQSSIILYQAEDGRTRIQCRFEDETIWLTQALIAELFQKDVRTVNEHLANIYDEGEVARAATIRNFRIVRFEGVREVAREIEHYSLPTILAVGYRVRSPRGAQFRQWATARLSEYLLKGFSIDDQLVEGEVEAGKLYTESDFNRIIEIKEGRENASRSSWRRSTSARVEISTHFNTKQQAFLGFVLAHYVNVGVGELDQEKLTPLLRLKYHDSITDAVADLGRADEIGRTFSGFQKHLYQEVAVA